MQLVLFPTSIWGPHNVRFKFSNGEFILLKFYLTVLIPGTHRCVQYIHNALILHLMGPGHYPYITYIVGPGTAGPPLIEQP